MNKRMTR